MNGGEKHAGVLNVDDVIIIHDDMRPRHLWKLGRIEELIKGADGVVRGSRIKMGKSKKVVGRPLNKIYPLEIMTPRSNTDATVSIPDIRVRRMAAIAGE